MKNLISESKKIKLSKQELDRQRNNWHWITKHRIASYFNEFSNFAKDNSYPFSMNCRIHEKTRNHETVQLSLGPNMTGVIENIDKPNVKGSKSHTEQGAALVASFSNGYVNFIMYPYKSELSSMSEKEIILYHGKSNDDITRELLIKCTDKFLLYARMSSVFGDHGSFFTDYFKLGFMRLADTRNRRKTHQTSLVIIMDLLKIVIGGIVGSLITIYV